MFRFVRCIAISILVGALAAGNASAQSSYRDVIAEWLEANRDAPTRLAQSAERGKKSNSPGADPAKDPRAGDKSYEQAKRLMQAIDAILSDAAKQRTASQKLPSKDDFILTPLWTETKEDREQRIRELLDAALGIVTDVPVVDVQKRIEQRTVRQKESA